MEKRYTVFVSSTYVDLKAERDAVFRTIMEAGHIPLGMEAFGAASASQWEIITDTIDTADYYVLILGARYGSVDEDTKISFTEMEFDYALQKGIPCLVLSMAEGVTVDPKFVDNAKKLKLFKDRAMHNRQSAFWKSEDELASKVIKGLTSEFRRSPRPGWVRPQQILNPNTIEELAQLSKENRELKTLLESMKTFDSMSRYDSILSNKIFTHEGNSENAYTVFHLLAVLMAGSALEFHDIRTSIARIFRVDDDDKALRSITSEVIDFMAKIGLVKAEAIGKAPAVIGGRYNSPGHVQIIYVLTDDGRKYLAHVSINSLLTPVTN